MAIGYRQLVILTKMADEWPTGVTRYVMRRSSIPGCEHPTVEVARRRGRSSSIEKQRTCYCWGQLEKTARFFTSLAKRGFIEKGDDDLWHLTPKGWHYLDRERRAPVSVSNWDGEGLPVTYEIRKSRRADFQPLYHVEEAKAAKEAEGG
jgi:hypothetical protein